MLRAKTASLATPHNVSLAPQTLHKPGIGGRFPWSEAFDRIFRNEEVAGSNPASSTDRPGQSDCRRVRICLLGRFCGPTAPRTPHRFVP